MSDNSITLAPKAHDKLGIVHVGVTRDGFIAVGGAPRNIKDGEEIVFDRVGIQASRKGDEYTFNKLN